MWTFFKGPRLSRPPRFAYRAALLCLVLAGLGVAAYIGLSRTSENGSDDVASALAPALAGARIVEPRLTGGFAWAALPATRSGVASTVRATRLPLQALIASARIEQAYRRAPTPASTRAYAAALLLRGETDAAVRALEDLTERDGKDGLAFSDLAAALLVRGTELDSLAALDAAEHALAIEPRSPEARFNRALALEALALDARASAAWRSYAQIDADSPWAREAAGHLERLAAREPPSAPALADRLSVLTPRDTHALDVLVRTESAEARRVTTEVLLKQWAVTAAATAASAPIASFDLALAVATRHGALREDRYLPELLQRFSTLQGPARRDAAAGWLAYLDGRQLSDRWEFARAHAAFTRARTLLSRAGSPGRWEAQLYLAIAAFQQGALEESQDALTRVVHEARRRGYRQLLGRAAWVQGILHATRGTFSEALQSYGLAIETFEALDERESLATVRSLAADTQRTLGDVRGAWRQHFQVLRTMSRTWQVQRRQSIYFAAGQAALTLGNSRAALAFYDEYLEASRQTGSPMALAEAHLLRSSVFRTLDRRAERERDLTAAARLADESPDRTRADFIKARVQLEQARLGNDSPDQERKATEALTYLEATNRGYVLPDAYLTRAQVRLHHGDTTGGEADLQTGIRVFETQRRAVASAAHRISFFETGLELYDAMVSLCVRRGDEAGALTWLNRSRLPALSDQLSLRNEPLSPALLRASMPAGTAMIVYARVDRRLLAWRIEASSHQLIDMAVALDDLERDVSAWNDAIDQADDDNVLQSLATRLFDRVIRPLGSLTGVRRLIIVPDHPLHLVPFAAMRDRASSRFLVEHVSLLVIPSPSLGRRPADVTVGDTPAAVIVGAPDFDRSRFGFLPSLDHAALESIEISRAYPGSTVLTRGDATRSRLATTVRTADVLHFAGHAVVQQEFPDQSYLLLSPEGRDDGRVTVADLRQFTMPRLRLVVLAACRTAVGVTYRGEGVMGLARPFLEGGVPRVVATLWDIEDRATAPILVRLHQELRRGAPIEDALRTAQVETLRAQPLRAWASFVVLGTARDDSSPM